MQLAYTSDLDCPTSYRVFRLSCPSASATGRTALSSLLSPSTWPRQPRQPPQHRLPGPSELPGIIVRRRDVTHAFRTPHQPPVAAPTDSTRPAASAAPRTNQRAGRFSVTRRNARLPASCAPDRREAPSGLHRFPVLMKRGPSLTSTGTTSSPRRAAGNRRAWLVAHVQSS